MELIEIGQTGDLPQRDLLQSDILRSIVDATVAMYERGGFSRPWIGYVAVIDDVPVGTCGFKSPPFEGRVEIAYFTFPDREGQGIATWMASELVTIAKQTDASVTVIAQTLPEENASTAVLRKLGFRFVGSFDHAEDGFVWEWEHST